MLGQKEKTTREELVLFSLGELYGHALDVPSTLRGCYSTVVVGGHWSCEVRILHKRMIRCGRIQTSAVSRQDCTSAKTSHKNFGRHRHQTAFEISRCRQSHEPQRPLPRSFILPRLRVSLSSTDQHRNYGRLSSYHPNPQVHHQPTSLAQADGRVSTTPIYLLKEHSPEWELKPFKEDDDC